MSEIKSCPACGGVPQLDFDMGEWRYECECGVCGPWSKPGIGYDAMAAALSLWNALPRWPDWKPASEPPDIPVNLAEVTVLAYSPAYGFHQARYLGSGYWFPPGVTHWTPLPPGPGEGK